MPRIPVILSMFIRKLFTGSSEAVLPILTTWVSISVNVKLYRAFLPLR